jgi:hypothetical protein
MTGIARTKYSDLYLKNTLLYVSHITHPGGGRSIFFIALYYLVVTTQITLGY